MFDYINIAKWVANLLILGIAAAVWIAAIFIVMLVVITIVDKYKKFTS